MTDFVFFEDNDAIEATIPKRPVNVRNVDDIDVSKERDFNQGIDYYYINFNLLSGKVMQWKFHYESIRDTTYSKLLSLMHKLDSTDEVTNIAPAGYLVGVVDGTNTEFATNIPYVPGTIKLFLFGQKLFPGRDYDEVPETNSILFYTAPEAGAAIICDFKPLV